MATEPTVQPSVSQLQVELEELCAALEEMVSCLCWDRTAVIAWRFVGTAYFPQTAPTNWGGKLVGGLDGQLRLIHQPVVGRS